MVKIWENINLNKFNSVLEVGAGSGRTCSSLLKLRDNLNYTIVDIPPALFISQSNLINIFKNKKIFKYRYFNKFSDIEKDFISSDIKFLSPDQLKFIPEKFFSKEVNLNLLSIDDLKLICEKIKIKNYKIIRHKFIFFTSNLICFYYLFKYFRLTRVTEG